MEMRKHNVELTNTDSNGLTSCSRTTEDRTNCYPEPTALGVQAVVNPNFQDGFEVIREEYMDSVAGEYGTDYEKNTESRPNASEIKPSLPNDIEQLHIIYGSQNSVLMIRRIGFLRSEMQEELLHGVQAQVEKSLAKELELRNLEGSPKGSKSNSKRVPNGKWSKPPIANERNNC